MYRSCERLAYIVTSHRPNFSQGRISAEQCPVSITRNPQANHGICSDDCTRSFQQHRLQQFHDQYGSTVRVAHDKLSYYTE